MAKGIFITGTDTDIGKTVITAGLVYLLRSHKYNATYFKAALSGAIEEDGELIPGDTRLVSKVAGLTEDFEKITPYIYKTAVSPHIAAHIENKPIDLGKVMKQYDYVKQKYDYIVAEGSGGIVCPLIHEKDRLYLLEDLIKDLNMNTILVAGAGLGTINHTVLTVRYIKSIGIKVKGIIINGYEDNIMCNDNIKMIKKLTKVPILGVVNKIKDMKDEMESIDDIRKAIEESVKVDDLLKCMDEV